MPVPVADFIWADEHLSDIAAYDLGNLPNTIWSTLPDPGPGIGEDWDQPGYAEGGWDTPTLIDEVVSGYWAGASPALPPQVDFPTSEYVLDPVGTARSLDPTGHFGFWPGNFGETANYQQALFRWHFTIPDGVIAQFRASFWISPYSPYYFYNDLPVRQAGWLLLTAHITVNGHQIYAGIDPAQFIVPGENLLAFWFGEPFGPLNIGYGLDFREGVIAPFFGFAPWMSAAIQYEVLAPYVSTPTIDVEGRSMVAQTTGLGTQRVSFGNAITETDYATAYSTLDFHSDYTPGTEDWDYTAIDNVNNIVIQGFQPTFDTLKKVELVLHPYGVFGGSFAIIGPSLDPDFPDALTFYPGYLWPGEGDILLQICADAPGLDYPGEVLAGSSFPMTAVAGYGKTIFEFEPPVSLAVGETYWLVASTTATADLVLGAIQDTQTSGALTLSTGTTNYFSGISLSGVYEVGIQTATSIFPFPAIYFNWRQTFLDDGGNAIAAYDWQATFGSYQQFIVPTLNNCGLLTPAVAFNLDLIYLGPPDQVPDGTMTATYASFDGPATAGGQFSLSHDYGEFSEPRPFVQIRWWERPLSLPDGANDIHYGYLEQNQRLALIHTPILPSGYSQLGPPVTQFYSNFFLNMGTNESGIDEQVIGMKFASSGLHVLTAFGNGYSTLPGGIGNGNRRDPNHDAWPVITPATTWCSDDPYRYDITQWFVDSNLVSGTPYLRGISLYTDDQGYPMVIGYNVQTDDPDAGVVKVTWGPVRGTFWSGPTPWLWGNFPGIPSIDGYNHISQEFFWGGAVGGPSVTQVMRRRDGSFVLFTQTEDQQVGTKIGNVVDPDTGEITTQEVEAWYARCAYQILTSEDPLTAELTYHSNIPYAEGLPVHVHILGGAVDSSNVTHFFFLDVTDTVAQRQASPTDPRLPFVMTPIYHQAMGPDGTFGPAAKFDCFLGMPAIHYTIAEGHPSGGVAFAYVNADNCFLNAVFGSDITIPNPIGFEELPKGPEVESSPEIIFGGRMQIGNYFNTAFWLINLIYVGDTGYLFGQDFGGIRVARYNTDSFSWTGWSEVSTSVYADGLTNFPEGINVSYLPGRNQIAMLYSWQNATGAGQRATFFEWFNDPGGYDEFIPTGCTVSPCRATKYQFGLPQVNG